MKNLRSLMFIFFAVALAACQQEQKTNFVIGKARITDVIIPPKKAYDPKIAFSFSSIELFQDINALDQRQFIEYGTFYTEDFTIFQINNLDLLEDNLYISEIYLYFVDNTLHKIQAFTTKNMTDFFLSKYGGAKLVLKDRFNKDLAKQEGAVVNRGGKVSLNKNLNNYRLKWKSTDRLISYQVDESAQKNFEAIEELIDLDNQQKIKTQPKYIFTIQSDAYPKLLERVKFDELASIRND